MKKQIYIFICLTALTANLQASLPVQYWNDNVKKPKSSITHPLSLQQKCSQTIAMIKERKTVNLEKSIPILMEVLTTMPEPVPTEQEAEFISNLNGKIQYNTKSIKTGPSYELFNAIINKNEFLKNRNISLRQPSFIFDFILNYIIGMNACTAFNEVIITSSYDANNDASKLFNMHHELQHQLNGDTNQRSYITQLQNRSALADLTQTPYVRSILKPSIKNAQGQNLQDILEENGQSLQQEVRRYQEYRADTGALHSIDCPYCIKEASQVRFNNSEYDPDGYLYPWQFQPRIKKLQKQGTICQHHHENGEKIDTSITDSSTLMKRLNMIQK